jgi:hypothetical protein
VLARQPVHDGLHAGAFLARLGAGQHGREQLALFLGVVFEHRLAEEMEDVAGHRTGPRGRRQQRRQLAKAAQVREDAFVALREVLDGLVDWVVCGHGRAPCSGRSLCGQSCRPIERHQGPKGWARWRKIRPLRRPLEATVGNPP